MVLPYNRFKFFIILLAFAGFSLCAPHAHAGNVQGKKATPPLSKDHGTQAAPEYPHLSGDIHISADKLVSGRHDFKAEFSGNVLATQAGAEIQSDHLFVYYEKSDSAPSSGKTGGIGPNRINRIVARGNVKIRINDKTAFCDTALYTVADGLIILTGKNVRISDADNYIHGRRITLNRITGAISVSGGPEKRVEAVFNPGTEKTPAILRPKKED